MGFIPPIVGNYGCVHGVFLGTAQKTFPAVPVQPEVLEWTGLYYLGAEELTCFNLMRSHTSLSFDFHQCFLQPQFHY